MGMVGKVEVGASGACNEPIEGDVCYGRGGGGVWPGGVAWRCSGGVAGVLGFRLSTDFYRFSWIITI